MLSPEHKAYTRTHEPHTETPEVCAVTPCHNLPPFPWVPLPVSWNLSSLNAGAGISEPGPSLLVSSMSPSQLTFSIQMRTAVSCPEPHCTPARTRHKSRHLISIHGTNDSFIWPPQNPHSWAVFHLWLFLDLLHLPRRFFSSPCRSTHHFPLISLGSMSAPLFKFGFSPWASLMPDMKLSSLTL